MQHIFAKPYYEPTVHLGLKASNLFYLDQIKYLDLILWLFFICMQDFIVIHISSSLVGFDPAYFQPAQPFSRIVGQARGQDYRHICGSHPNGAKIGNHVN